MRARVSSAVWGLVGVLVGASIVAVGRAQEPPGIVTAQQFRLVDGEGIMRATLMVTPQGHPGLGLLDEDGDVRVMLRIGPQDDPGLVLYDGDLKVRAMLGIDPDGTAGLQLRDRDGNMVAALGAAARGGGGVTFFHQGPRPRALMGMLLGGPVVMFYDEEGNVTWRAP